jgi:hypothetical protein
MGLFTSFYPQLEEITITPTEVEEFNKHAIDKIELGDWKKLLKIFLDHSVRSNQSFFIRYIN